jgi:hypothetical protein
MFIASISGVLTHIQPLVHDLASMKVGVEEVYNAVLLFSTPSDELLPRSAHWDPCSLTTFAR